MDERAQKIYAELLRKRLKKTMPEHSERMDSISDQVLIDHERRHAAQKAEAFRERMQAARERLLVDLVPRA
jgi:hypothetical protein